MVARHIWDVDAASSSLATPTKGESKGTHPFHFLLNLIYYGQYSSKRRVISLRVRDRFIEIIDENEENLFSQRIKNIRKQIKKIFKHLHETCAVIEPCEFMLIWGTLQRCLICIESCISLVSDGYIGSANALFRQIYEFLVWAKVGIDSDTETLKEVNAAFYKGDLSHRILVTNILKAVKIDITNGSYSETELKAKGKEYIKNWVAVIGDSTFLHTGVNSLMNMVYNNATGTVIIMDNSTTGMTGHQDHAATGKTLQGDPTYAINIPALCRAMGVKNVHEVNAFDLPLLEKTIKEETAKDEVSVIITKTPCVLLDKRKKPLYIAHEDKCKKCGMCMKPGCPAMTKNADGTIHIDDTMCTGCGLCESLCKFGAIELVKEGE